MDNHGEGEDEGQQQQSNEIEVVLNNSSFAAAADKTIITAIYKYLVSLYY